MRVAVAGCCHGELDKIYETLALAEKRSPGPIDLLLCCGDFQAVRNEADLRCMAVPPKYRHMQTFYRWAARSGPQTQRCEAWLAGSEWVGENPDWIRIPPATDSLSPLLTFFVHAVSRNWCFVNVTFLFSFHLSYLFRKGSKPEGKTWRKKLTG